MTSYRPLYNDFFYRTLYHDFLSYNTVTGENSEKSPLFSDCLYMGQILRVLLSHDFLSASLS
jgi:hypothetical protein